MKDKIGREDWLPLVVDLGDNNIVSPPLAAWLPVLLYGPITVASFDAIHT